MIIMVSLVLVSQPYLSNTLVFAHNINNTTDPPGPSPPRIKVTVTIDKIHLNQNEDDGALQEGIFDIEQVAEMVVGHGIKQENHEKVVGAFDYIHDYIRVVESDEEENAVTGMAHEVYGKFPDHVFESSIPGVPAPKKIYEHEECSPMDEVYYYFRLVESDQSVSVTVAEVLGSIASGFLLLTPPGATLSAVGLAVLGFVTSGASLNGDDELGVDFGGKKTPGTFNATTSGAPHSAVIYWTIRVDEIPDPKNECSDQRTSYVPKSFGQDDSRTALLVNRFTDSLASAIEMNELSKMEEGLDDITKQEFDIMKKETPKKILGFAGDVFDIVAADTEQTVQKTHAINLADDAEQLVTQGKYDLAIATYNEAFLEIIQNDKKSQSEIPEWIKNNAIWWSDGIVSDREFASAMGFLVKEKIILANLPFNPDGTIVVSENLLIPSWIKNNAKWWAENKITDNEFKEGIQFMIQEDIISFSSGPRDLGHGTIELDDKTIIRGATILMAHLRAFEQMLEITNHNQEFFEDTSDKYWDLYADSKDKSQMEEALKFDNLASSAQIESTLTVQELIDARARYEKFLDLAVDKKFDTSDLKITVEEKFSPIIQENQIETLQDLKDAYDIARDWMRIGHKEYQNLVFGIDTSYTKTGLIKPTDEFWEQSCAYPDLVSDLPHKEIFFGSGFEKYGLTCKIIAMIFSDTPVETVSEALKDLEALNDLEPLISNGTPTPQPENSSPSVGEIKAVLNPPTTTYSVVATDPDDDSLTYTWTNSNTCGTFTFSGKTATWSHPHPPCGEETYHPGIITVTVDDGHGHKVTKTYDKGSQDSSGAIPSQTQAELSAVPSSVSGSHKIGVPPTGSPCPTPMGLVSLTSDQQGTWSIQSKPTWMNVTMLSSQAIVEFNCDINPVPQTLNGKIVFAFTNSNGVTTLEVPVTVQVT